MRTRMLYGLCVLFLLAGVAFAQDRMVIIFKDGRYQSIDISTIQKIEYQTAQDWKPTFTSPPGVPRGTNLAIGKTATQSSVGHGGDPRRAIDGNTDGDYFKNSVSHTDQQSQAWWQVDLGSVYRIGSIRIWNRTDCCAERLSNFYVIVSETPFAASDLNSAIRYSGSWNYHVGGIAGTPTDIPVHRTGRYVRIQLAGTNYLSLAEVEVISD